MLAALFYLFMFGFALFLLGFSIFMHFENRKFGDNQFTMKLLPPPPGRVTASYGASFGVANGVPVPNGASNGGLKVLADPKATIFGPQAVYYSHPSGSPWDGPKRQENPPAALPQAA